MDYPLDMLLLQISVVNDSNLCCAEIFSLSALGLHGICANRSQHPVARISLKILCYGENVCSQAEKAEHAETERAADRQEHDQVTRGPTGWHAMCPLAKLGLAHPTQADDGWCWVHGHTYNMVACLKLPMGQVKHKAGHAEQYCLQHA